MSEQPKRISKYFQQSIPTAKKPAEASKKPIDKEAYKEIEKELDEIELPSYANRTIIDKLGLGPEIVRLRAAGMTQEDIAVQLSLSRDQIMQWLRKYQNMSPDAKRDTLSKNVFDVSNGLQECFDYLHTILKRIEGNGELEVKTVDKILKSLQMAGDLLEKVELMKEQERFRTVVLSLLDQYAPGIKFKALQELGKAGPGLRMLRPL